MQNVQTPNGNLRMGFVDCVSHVMNSHLLCKPQVGLKKGAIGSKKTRILLHYSIFYNGSELF